MPNTHLPFSRDTAIYGPEEIRPSSDSTPRSYFLAVAKEALSDPLCSHRAFFIQASRRGLTVGSVSPLNCKKGLGTKPSTPLRQHRAMAVLLLYSAQSSFTWVPLCSVWN